MAEIAKRCGRSHRARGLFIHGWLLAACATTAYALDEDAPADSIPAPAGICAAYQRTTALIPMRDGAKLYTEIYLPKHSKGPTGILMDRTPYLTDTTDACAPRFAALFAEVWQDGYILVRQSIRGRGRSEGVFILGAPLRHMQDPKAIDEATDAWDTIDWLIKNIPGNNGKVALLGVSYDAKLALMAAIDPHPALVAVSPQAPPIDQWIGDDHWRNGAFRLNYVFEQAARLQLSENQQPFPFDNADTFEWYLQLGSLSRVNERYFHGQSEFWNNMTQHRTHDAFWQARNLEPYLKSVRVPVLTTGGWWDAEDFYGSMTLAKALARNGDDPHKFRAVIGPWIHGSWTDSSGRSLEKIDFGSDTAAYWRQEVERPWLAHWVLGEPDPHLPAALSFRTGANQWMRYDAWPPQTVRGRLELYLSCNGMLRFERPAAKERCTASYVSDPSNPIPYLPRPIGSIGGGKNFGGQAYHSLWPTWQAQDQRFATQRPDTLLFTTMPLTEDVVLTGEAELTLHIATTGTDGDFIAKLIDIYPGVDAARPELGGYHLMLNHAVLAGRYWAGDFTRPAPLTPHHVYELKLRFSGNDHAFLKGHRIAIQIQSTLFPLIARNAQSYVENIFAGNAADFHPATITLVSDGRKPNVLSIPRNE